MLLVNIVGIGPGNPELLTAQARKAIDKSNVLIGDKRMLEIYKVDGKKTIATIKISEIAETIKNLDSKKDEVAILVSGDVGFFSLTKVIRNKLENSEVKVYCGISSLVYFSQRIATSWDDAKIISMHGRNNNLIQTVFTNKKVFSLTGGDNSAQKLCADLCAHDMGDVKVHVGENLSYENEKITSGTAKEISKLEFPSLSVMMIFNDNAKDYSHMIHGIEDDLFTRSKVPMTKQEVRAISISKLKPGVSDLIYDIGAGTGSVSIELALQAREGKVFAFEKNSTAVELIGLNKTKFGVKNLEVIAGEASEAIKKMPKPDCVFIGGSGGNLKDMLDTIYEKNSNVKIVMNAITIETIAEISNYYANHDQYSIEIVNAFVARSKKLGSYNLMMAQNPVYVVTAIKKEV